LSVGVQRRDAAVDLDQSPDDRQRIIKSAAKRKRPSGGSVLQLFDLVTQ
jgi:hypothetical protein